MRAALLLLLVCLNLGTALWWALHRETPRPPPPPLPAGVATLTLLSEAGDRLPAPASPEPAAAAAQEPMVATTLCLTLGPFPTPGALRRAMAALTPHAGAIQFREDVGTELRGYRVYLPAAGARDQALATARQLAASGVNDYYVVTAGAQENSVSLGTYRDQAEAQKRHDELLAKGFAPVVEARNEEEPRWWIDVDLPQDFAWQRVLPEPFGIGAQPRRCQ